MKTLGLYLHIPFCISKCRYCDFYSIPEAARPVPDKYVDALCEHMHEYALQARDYAVTTIYIGGGTPSLLTADQMKKVIKKLKSSFHLSAKCEISMEMNPKTADYTKLRAFRKLGINRLSIGIQSFDDADLNICGRVHNAADAVSAFTAARKAKFENISFDLMYGIPGQTLQTVVNNINTAIRLEPEHISLYGLKVEEGTPFWFDRHELAFPDEETERSMYFTAVGLLEKAGYHQYEISNFARRGYSCRHNLKYWHDEEYLGIGASAHSFLGGKRTYYPRDIEYFISGNERLTEGDGGDEEEFCMLALRLREGLTQERFYARFHHGIPQKMLESAKQYEKYGLCRCESGGISLTRRGFLLSNSVISEIIL